MMEKRVCNAELSLEKKFFLFHMKEVRKVAPKHEGYESKERWIMNITLEMEGIRMWR